jgi:hypothetical protein
MLAEVTANDSQLPADIHTSTDTTLRLLLAVAVVVAGGQNFKSRTWLSSMLAHVATALNFGDGGGKASVCPAVIL